MAGADRTALFGDPHRRWDPLRGDWVLVSPGRSDRPWQGRVESAPHDARPPYDPSCYLCPGNVRASGQRNPSYDHTFVFTNDFAALRPETSDGAWTDGDGLLRAEGERGTSRVVCFSPRHDLSLGDMDVGDVRRVIERWADETAALGSEWRWVQVFENRGEGMGASNPHPHGQVWAGSALPGEPAREDGTQREHLARTGRRLLVDIAELESDGPRVVDATGEWLVIVPFWAVWPFETLILPRRTVARMSDLDHAARDDLAAILGRLVRRYDALFGVPFPYSMGWHGAPFGVDAAVEAWQLHAHVYPPLLRSATVRKFMVGYELLAEPQRDILPEDAAARLRGVLT
ncbi:MAG TPA: UDP-glucose--hexose-1-phosphate uridylyltransferase [Candidatus Limnocylindrales bacterium]|nr:UDP-glucose--hexose-1-phosphate uridylyltransferase [Candidatus Limnocylindrales bacterium]